MTAEWFEHFQLPLVRINANPAFYNPDGLLAHVNMDSEKSMKILLEKLYSMGHRRIHLLAPDSKEIEERRTRYQGFYRYMKSRRIQHPEQYCIFGMKGNSVERNLELLKQAVSGGVTALIAVDEGAVRSTLSLIEKLKESAAGYAAGSIKDAVQMMVENGLTGNQITETLKGFIEANAGATAADSIYDYLADKYPEMDWTKE